MWKAVFSRTFSLKRRDFVQSRQDDISKAVERVLVDPFHTNYQRSYLKPYKQEHPTDKALTIFFAIPNKPTNRVFFVWVNDDNHPHNTHGNQADPCIKEFLRLKNSNQLEDYDEDFHEGKLTLKPRPNSPIFLKFEKYGASVHSNILDDGSTRFAMGVASLSRLDDFFDHYKLFFEKIREHFIQHQMPFEFRAMDGDINFLDILDKNLDAAYWRKTIGGGMTVFTMV